MATIRWNIDSTFFLVKAGDSLRATITLVAVAGVLAVSGGASVPTVLTGMSFGTPATYALVRYIRRTWPWTSPLFGEDKNVRLTSKREPVGETLKGKGDFKNRGTVNMVASGIGRTCEAGSVTNEVNENTFKVVGADPGLIKHAFDSFAGNKVRVVVRFADHVTQKFEKKYGPDEIVHDIITDIWEERKMKITKICAMKDKEEIDDSFRVKTLQEKDVLESLMAYCD